MNLWGTIIAVCESPSVSECDISLLIDPSFGDTNQFYIDCLFQLLNIFREIIRFEFVSVFSNVTHLNNIVEFIHDNNP